jgi:Cu+-exporting ATPase
MLDDKEQVINEILRDIEQKREQSSFQNTESVAAVDDMSVTRILKDMGKTPALQNPEQETDVHALHEMIREQENPEPFAKRPNRKRTNTPPVFGDRDSRRFSERAVYTPPDENTDENGFSAAHLPPQNVNPRGDRVERVKKPPIWEDTDDYTLPMAEGGVSSAAREENPQRQENPEEPNSKKPQKTTPPLTDAQKHNLAVLSRDRALEDPDELILSINPLHVVQDAIAADSQNTAQTAESPNPGVFTGRPGGHFAGDTQGVAGDDLKQISELQQAQLALPEDDSVFTTAEIDVKSYQPGQDIKQQIKQIKQQPQQMTAAHIQPEAEHVLTAKEKRSNTALVEQLNRAISKGKEADEAKVQGGLSAEGGARQQKGEINALNIDYSNQIISDASDYNLNGAPVYEQEQDHKIAELAQKRKRKLSEFVLDDVEREPDPMYYDLPEDKSDEADEDVRATAEKLHSQRKGLTARFILLAIITLFLTFVVVANESGQHMAYRIAGFIETAFLDHRFDVVGYLFFQMIMGLAGVFICLRVVQGGIISLFNGKPDCDSLAAVGIVVPIIAVLPQLTGTGLIQMGQAGVFVAAGLWGLLFNTLGKMLTLARTQKNFAFVFGDFTKYFGEIVPDDQLSSAFTKGVLDDKPTLACMRKTGFCKDFINNSYRADIGDRFCGTFVYVALALTVMVGLIAYFIPYFLPDEKMMLSGNMLWAFSCATAFLSAVLPFSVMFLANFPLFCAARKCEERRSVILGYDTLVEFSGTNSIMVDAGMLFPPGSINFKNIMQCSSRGAANSMSIDDILVTAASLAIKSGSVTSPMFLSIIGDNYGLLSPVDDLLYEVNMGVAGWIDKRRVMLGNREQMKHHGVLVPDIKKEKKYAGNADAVYLAVGGEVVAILFIEIKANREIRHQIDQLQRQDIALTVRTKDSLVTVNKLTELFDLNPEKVRVLPFDLFEAFDVCTKYVPRGNGALTCDGSFVSFVKAIISSKKLSRSMTSSYYLMMVGAFVAVVTALLFVLFGLHDMLTVTNAVIYNAVLWLIMLIMQSFTRYD